jgi:molecular chaperone GrpE (heat shock protein)
MLTEYGLRTLKGLNTIRDWKRNRSWVNRGVKVLGAFSQAQIEDLKETYPNLSSTISRLWNKVEEGRKRAAKKQALNNFSGSELFNDIYLPIIDEIAPTLETWADHFIKWKKTDSEREKFIKNEQDKVATLILRTIDKVGGGGY